jgi:hypothetical protein
MVAGNWNLSLAPNTPFCGFCDIRGNRNKHHVEGISPHHRDCGHWSIGLHQRRHQSARALTAKAPSGDNPRLPAAAGFFAPRSGMVQAVAG